MSFLKAEWRKLIFANYIVDKQQLTKYLPAGTELDLWNGNCFVSLICFMFLNTRLLGVKVPFHSNFEEVNLRFYVKRFENGEWKRGVVFLKEIVPKRALALVANTLYNEKYETLPMKHSWDSNNGIQTIEYKWKKLEKWNSIKVQASVDKFKIDALSETEFITEHYWGYASVNQNASNEYEVTHPRWDVYQVEEYEIDVDFASIYGIQFDFLKSLKPSSVMLAEGSAITIEGKKRIRLNT